MTISAFRASMAPETRRRAVKRRESGDASTVRAPDDARGKRHRAATATEGKTKARGRSAVEQDCGGGGPPSVSGRSAIDLSERDVLSALCERALSNSVPAHVLEQYPDDDGDDGSWDDGPAEVTTSEGTSGKTSSLRARRALPGLRLPNEAFNGEGADEAENEVENALADAAENKLPEEGWLQPCFACGRITWQNISIGGFRVYRCTVCADGFRARAAAMEPDRGDEGANGARDDAAADVLASLMRKLRSVVEQVGGEQAKGSFQEIEG